MKAEINSFLHKNPRADEVRLFREMSRILRKNGSRCVFIEETHGRRGLVTFTSQIKRSRMTWTKEIADLLVLVYSRQKREIRLSLLQAKYHRTKRSPFLIFHGDYLQLELLRDRPIIAVPNLYGLPADFLSLGGRYESFRTYGVFYHDANGEIDLLFSIASLLKEKSRRCQKSGNISFPGLNGCPVLFLARGNHQEVLSTCSIDFYHYSLLSNRIGVPITESLTLSLYVKKLLTFVRQSLEDKDSSDLINEIMNSILDVSFLDKDDNPVRVNPNMLIIEADEENNASFLRMT